MDLFCECHFCGLSDIPRAFTLFFRLLEDSLRDILNFTIRCYRRSPEGRIPLGVLWNRRQIVIYGNTGCIITSGEVPTQSRTEYQTRTTGRDPHGGLPLLFIKLVVAGMNLITALRHRHTRRREFWGPSEYPSCWTWQICADNYRRFSCFWP